MLETVFNLLTAAYFAYAFFAAAPRLRVLWALLGAVSFLAVSVATAILIAIPLLTLGAAAIARLPEMRTLAPAILLFLRWASTLIGIGIGAFAARKVAKHTIGETSANALLHYANPSRFLALSAILLPLAAIGAALLLAAGLVLGLAVPPDYQQGMTVTIMFVHVPAAMTAEGVYAAIAVCSLFSMINRHPLADVAAKTAAPLGAMFTVLALVTGSLWGKPMWGAWWAWDARLTSVLLLFFIYLGYMALRSAIEDETRAASAAAILALACAVILPVIYFSVEWWNTLHQGESIMSGKVAPVYLWPLLLMIGGYALLFAALWLLRIRTEIFERRARTLMLAAAP